MKNNPKNYSFTLRPPTKLKQIISEVWVSLPIIDKSFSASDPRIFETTALWDTGATNSVVTKKIAHKLGLKPISATIVHHANGVSPAVNVYLVNIYLPNGIGIPGVRVTECSDQSGDFGMIIGMDIITLGDFCITNQDNKSVVSFRIPSLTTTDYLEEFNDTQKVSEASEQTRQQLKGKDRNLPCPCGSGKKIKQCCGKSSG